MSLKKLNFKHITIIMLVSIIISVMWHYFDGSLCDVFNEKKLNIDSDVSVHYIDVGQGDCELILDHGMSILIDSGEVEKGNSVVKYLKSCGIKKIDLFIGTHPHTDHIGGFLTVAKNFDIDRIIIPELPKNIIPTTSTYTNFLKLIDDKKIPVDRPQIGKSYKIGEGRLDILGPVGQNYNEINNWSICARYVYKNTSFLFGGDMEKEAEKDLLNTGQMIESDVFKLNHHGSKTSNTKKFLSVIKAKIYVIEVGKNNTYQHPSVEVMKRIDGAKVYRTDLNGSVVISTDGSRLDVRTEKGEG